MSTLNLMVFSCWLYRNLIIASLAIIMMSMMHPFHIGVCEMKYNTEKELMEISYRVFWDDMEQLLQKRWKPDGPMQSPQLDSILQVYFSEMFWLTIDGQKGAMQYLGYEIEEEALWCYFQIKSLKPYRELKIRNTVLFDHQEEQINILHYNRGAYSKSLRFSPFQPDGMITED